jgi:hypothetical protein
MKLRSELLGKLHKLKPRDRAWIVERLSEQERAQLLANVAAPGAEPEVVTAQLSVVEGRATQAEQKPIDVVRSLSRVEPRQVAAVIKNEPAWLIAVIASEQQQAWCTGLLDALPAAQRTDVERIQLKHLRFGAALAESATRLILTRCHNGQVPVESAFERIVERLSTARTKKRLTLHL